MPRNDARARDLKHHDKSGHKGHRRTRPAVGGTPVSAHKRHDKPPAVDGAKHREKSPAAANKASAAYIDKPVVVTFGGGIPMQHRAARDKDRAGGKAHASVRKHREKPPAVGGATVSPHTSSSKSRKRRARPGTPNKSSSVSEVSSYYSEEEAEEEAREEVEEVRVKEEQVEEREDRDRGEESERPDWSESGSRSSQASSSPPAQRVSLVPAAALVPTVPKHPPPPPPPKRAPPASLPLADHGFWFGHNRQLDIEGPAVCGRWIKAKSEFMWLGEWRPLPKIFHSGGDPMARKGGKSKGKVKGKRKATTLEEERVFAVMGLVIKHECEYREWSECWGPKAPAVGGIVPGWTRYMGPMPTKAEQPFFYHKQLSLSVGHSSSSSVSSAGSSILHTSAAQVGQPLAAYDSRDVFIVSLPELFIANIDHRTAADIYSEWLEAEIIIGRKSRRGSST